ncbi:MAG: OsmC family protein [Cyclobacteriaceae bacterium]|nr:OsmC family protein [Cyclobacteriaceae bacterium]
MHIKSEYLGQLRTEATHVKSGERLLTDAPTDNHGKGETFSPTDLVAASLASCMMTIMGIEAQKLGFDVTGLSADTQKIMKNDPRTISAIRIVFHWPEPGVPTEKLAHLKEKALSCPVALCLHPSVRQEVTFDF